VRHNVKAVDLADLWGADMTTLKNNDNAPLKSDKSSWDFRFADALIPGVRYKVRAISPDGVTFDFDVNADGRLSNLYFKSAGRIQIAPTHRVRIGSILLDDAAAARGFQV
jgi:hypothetical protein